MSLAITAPADPYDRLAPAYDVLSAGYDHERWLTELLALLSEHGLRGRRVLDVGCGTGKSVVPLLRRGFAVTGVDRSAGMLEVARARLGDDVELVRADMRELPCLGAFDLVACLDDGVNHLLTAPTCRAPWPRWPATSPRAAWCCSISTRCRRCARCSRATGRPSATTR